MTPSRAERVPTLCLDGVGDDSLLGGADADTLRGAAGDDIIKGGAGADSLDGGAGTGDVVDYSGSSAGVTVDLATGMGVGGDAAGDAIDGFEIVMGSGQNDKLIAATSSAGLAGSSLLGGAGDDILIGGAGADSLAGGLGGDAYRVVGGLDADTISDTGGADTLFLGNHTMSGATPDALVISKLTLSQSGNDLVIQSLTSAGDTITIADHYDSSGAPAGAGAIENILADDGDGDAMSRAKLTTDQAKLTALLALYTQHATAISSGMAVPNSLTTTRAFTDGWGLPPRVLDYSAEANAVMADLTFGPTPTPAATVINLGRALRPAEIALISAIIGSSGDDLFTGRDAEANSITGGMGNDSIFGLAGADVLQGDDGDDTIEGGADGDTLDGGMHTDGDLLSYASSPSTVGVMVDLAASTVAGGHADGDVIANFEHGMGGAGDDTLSAAASGSSLLGGAGDDNLNRWCGRRYAGWWREYRQGGLFDLCRCGDGQPGRCHHARDGRGCGGRCADRYRIGDRLEHGGFVAGRHGGRDADRRDGR